MGLYKELEGQREEYLKTHQEGFIEGRVYRSFSIFFNLLFIRLRISPNAITWLSLAADFLVVYMMYIDYWIIAGILVNLAPIFDSSDGEVARYYRSKKKPKEKKYYGMYLDNVVGTIGFSIILLFAGYFLGNVWIGIFATYGLLMVILTSGQAAAIFQQEKEKIARNFENSIFGKTKNRVSFNMGKQRILTTLAVLFASLPILFVFGLLANAFWIIKFWAYRNS